MQWRFDIVDRNGVEHVIDEPVGWADIKFKLTRDKDMHGVFYDYTANNFEFWGAAAQLIYQEYETYGIEGLMFLRIRYYAGNSLAPFSTGRMIFAKYEDNNSAGDFTVSIGVDNISEIVTLKNRIDQKVDITALTGFDNVTSLSSYNKAPFSIALPSKAILFKTLANNNTTPSITDLVQDPQWVYIDDVNPGQIYGRRIKAFIVLGYNNIISTDINESNIASSPGVVRAANNQSELINASADKPSHGLAPIIDVKASGVDVKCAASTVTLKYRLKGKFVKDGYRDPDELKLMVVKQNASDGSFTTLASHDLNKNDGPTDVSNTISNLVFAEGDKLFYYAWVFFPLDNLHPMRSYTLTMDPECFVEVSSASKCEPTPADVFMVNETVSRVIENISNNKLKLYSSYFGRTDSQPYSMPINGPGSQAAITSGLKIRRVKNNDGTNTSIFTTLKDIFANLSAIHNLGLGVEALTDSGDMSDDLTNMNGQFVVRIENWKHFYQSEVIFRCPDVAAIQRNVQPDQHIATFKTGFDKWEAEQFNGLDEILTKREYATQITQADNKLEKTCKLIASGYAIEVTRRQDTTTTDWRYDNELFIICVTPESGSYKVELGVVGSAANILDPDSLYNFRISPARNAMRWYDRIMSSFKDPAAQVLKFTAGEGNLVASGEMTSSFDKIENRAIKENQNIDASMFADPNRGLPINSLESVKFDYPISQADFKKILNKPHGLIEYSIGNMIGQGWISSLTYEPNDGIGSFELIPKILK